MPFWVHGRDAATGQPRDSLFLEVENEADARQQAAEVGMTVEEVEFVGRIVEDPPAPTADDPPAHREDAPRTEPVAVLRCARCNSNRVVPRAAIWDRDRNTLGDSRLQAYVYSNPDAFVFKGTVYATLYARICADCGHAELFAVGAEELYEAYRQSQVSTGVGQ